MSIDEAISALEKAEANKLNNCEYSKEYLAQWLQEFEMDLEAVIASALETEGLKQERERLLQ